jgi:hypothetical protein
MLYCKRVFVHILFGRKGMPSAYNDKPKDIKKAFPLLGGKA